MKRPLLAVLIALLLTGCAREVEQAPSSLPIPPGWRQQVGPA
ncbi:lipoprotein, partial [Pantoea dispersa]